MPKILNVRERVHQPFRDTLVRTAGWSAGNLQDRTKLFIVGGKSEGESNFFTSAVLPSDQSYVALALRVFIWGRNPIQRGPSQTPSGGGIAYPLANGDFQFNGAGSIYDTAQAAVANGQAPASIQDVHRFYWQASEQLLWSFGAGLKNSIDSMPSAYFPYGGGLHGQLGGATDLIHWDNGMPSHDGILRLGRAIIIPSRQNVRCEATIVALSANGNDALFNLAQGARNLLSLRDNLNAVDGMNKVISFTFDGLQSREVQ